MYINSNIWHNEELRKLSDFDKAAYLYLLTSPHSNMMGFYVLPLEYMAHDLGGNITECERTLYRLVYAGLIKRDTDKKIVLIPDFLKHNPIGGPYQLKGVVNLLKEMPATKLTAEFYELIKEYLTDQTRKYLDDVKALIPEKTTAAKKAKERK